MKGMKWEVMQDRARDGYRCNGQISLVICFKALYTYNMTKRLTLPLFLSIVAS